MGLSFTAPAKRAAVLVLCIGAINACSDERDKALAANLETAEGMIDAFYSFDASRLRPFLSRAGEAQGSALGYQAWAEGGNYVVLKRASPAPSSLKESAVLRLSCLKIWLQSRPTPPLAFRESVGKVSGMIQWIACARHYSGIQWSKKMFSF